ncbi:hypothetical protein [Rummeliibacillus sp. SL167]|uniref:hypothetical protein n=1 Tax=Rummeliibacillus sp. SL167 TaxID=2579792 RepID=UPI001645F4E9|nr:hypothetical protein [Rummeliibacillus sp. SL167]
MQRRIARFPEGVEQAAAKIFINGPENTGFFKNYATDDLIFVKSTRVIIDKKE